jgi:hypothetical protein
MRLLSLLAIILCTLSCENNNYDNIYYSPDNATIFNDSLTFSLSGKISLPLDSVSSMSSQSVQISYLKDSQQIYSILNPMENEIAIYDFTNKRLLQKIPISQEELNKIGTGNGFLSHYIINLDSIFLCNSFTLKTYLVNSSGQILKSYKIMDSVEYGSDKAVPLASTEMPLIFKDNNFYIIGSWNDPSVKDHTKVNTVLVLNLQNGNVSRIFPRPDLYNAGNWGRNYMYLNLYGTYNPNTERFIYSFAADPFVYEMSGEKKKYVTSQHYIGSKYFQKITPMSLRRFKKFSGDESAIFDFTHPAFYKIIYDPFRHLYYRSAMLPVTKEEYKNPAKRYNRQEVIIIADEKFRKVGEYMLPGNRYVPSNFFVTKEGLHLLLKPKFQPSEDSMTYEVLTPIKNK